MEIESIEIKDKTQLEFYGIIRKIIEIRTGNYIIADAFCDARGSQTFLYPKELYTHEKDKSNPFHFEINYTASTMHIEIYTKEDLKYHCPSMEIGFNYETNKIFKTNNYLCTQDIVPFRDAKEKVNNNILTFLFLELKKFNVIKMLDSKNEESK